MADIYGTVTDMTTTQRATLSTAGGFIAARQAFSANDTLTGKSMSYMPHEGRMPASFGPELGSASSAEDFYVVFSYDTPIAWYANGVWTMPKVKYSSTTSRHQGIVRRAVFA